MSVGDIVGEPLLVHGIARSKQREEMVAKLFDRVGLRSAQMRNFPHEFSGGQRQRIGIARALALNPTLIIRSEEHTSELQSLLRIQYAGFCLTKKRQHSEIRSR